MNNKGFTFVELMSVLFLISILVLIASPSFVGLKGKSDIEEAARYSKIYETNINIAIMKDKDFLEKENLTSIKREEIVNLSNGKIYFMDGEKNVEILPEKKYYVLPRKFSDSEPQLEGIFVLSPEDRSVFYVGEF